MAERRSIFITGGASGIGQAIALYFAERGWFVGIADVNEKGMEETLGQIAGGFKYAHRLDVRDRAQWDEALAAFETAAGGRIDVVVNNAGIGAGGDIATMPVDEIDRCLDINLRGVLYGAQAAYPYLKKTAPGSALINTASAAGILGSSGMSVYCATKFGVRGIAESLDAEWADDGIKVASICPSFIDTPLLDGTGSRNSNELIRDRVTDAGLEITPVVEVAEAAWKAVHGDDLHYLVGKTAKKMNFAKRWMPGRLRQQARTNLKPLGQ
ncbi:NADP-dependent 3-hydroxy acid dehydrogenase YdfG [Altererythrobacter xiamenensis]|uniref:NADP-dependent 3-hydroxy acid dehydrogenase YdfG n=1 Tax=Altererythrobacter xiamenensis TaxID=1316679 RepID=A0A1Y6EKT5_9SPHN|nr:SDR family oxidoreductase [Altererythrobacter xiamenensis]SMQ61821.1 NADP-dependent 3-hydroxy acid dehydrogenase YdfG [Altererythrobacter xiamenensis]